MDEAQEPAFDKALQKFIDENELGQIDQELLTHDKLEPSFPKYQLRNLPDSHVQSIVGAAASRRDRAAMAIELLAIRTSERQAESQDRHAKAMKWLTIALFVVAAFEAAGTVVSALIALGVLGR